MAQSKKPSGRDTRAGQTDRDAALKASLAQLRELLQGGVVLTAHRIQEAMDEAVSRGRMTRQDAEELVSGLVSTGRQQAADVISDLEQLLGRSRSERNTAAGKAAELVAREVERAGRAVGVLPSEPKEEPKAEDEPKEEPKAAEAPKESAPKPKPKPKAKTPKPKAKPTPKAPKKEAEALPIEGYDGLNVKDVTAQLDRLSPPELRVIRSHEERTRDRKGVLAAIDKRLGA